MYIIIPRLTKDQTKNKQFEYKMKQFLAANKEIAWEFINLRRKMLLVFLESTYLGVYGVST